MLSIAFSIFTLLLGTALMLLGIGLQGTLLGLRAAHENFPVAVISYIMSAYFVGFSIGSYLCPSIIRRVGHIRTYTALVAIASAAAITHVLLIDPIAWIFLRVITGICMVGFYMVIESWLNTLAPNNLRGKFLSAYMTITLLALATSQSLLSLADITEYTLFAITSIMMSIAVVPVALTRVDQPKLVESPILRLAVIYHQSPLGVVGAIVAGAIMGAFWGMTAVYGSRIGMDKIGVAWLFSTTILGGATLQWTIGKASDHFDRRSVLSITALLAAILAIIAYMYGYHPSELLYGVYFLFGGFAFSLYSLSVAHVNDQLKPEQSLDASQSLLQLYGFGAIVGPLVAGISMDQYSSRSLPLVYAVALFTLTIFALYRQLTRPGPPVEEQEAFIPMIRTSSASIDMDPRTDSEPDNSYPEENPS